MILEHTVKNEENGVSVKSILKNSMHLSRKQIIRLKANNYIFKNNISCVVRTPVKAGDLIKVKIFEHRVSNEIIATKMPLHIIYEDEYIIAINKEKNTLVHPVGKEFSHTLSNGLKYYYEQKGIYMVARPVGRLDRNTTGVIIFAKNAHVHAIMVEEMKKNSSYKKYIAVISGCFKDKQGLIDLPIKRAPDSIISRVVSKDGKDSQTAYKVLADYHQASLVEFELLTGRTHQIRVHAKACGVPLVGDTLYGKASPFIDRQALHSYESRFIHPFTKKEVLLRAKLPEDILSLITSLKKH